MKLFWLFSYSDYLIVSAGALMPPDRSVFGQLQPRSYADELIDRLYACFFEDLLDLSEEYDRFYRQDYPDLREFLYWKYNVPEDILETVADDLTWGARVGYGKTTAGGDTNLHSLFESEEGTGLLKLMFTFQENEPSEDPDRFCDE